MFLLPNIHSYKNTLTHAHSHTNTQFTDARASAPIRYVVRTNIEHNVLRNCHRHCRWRNDPPYDFQVPDRLCFGWAVPQLVLTFARTNFPMHHWNCRTAIDWWQIYSWHGNCSGVSFVAWSVELLLSLSSLLLAQEWLLLLVPIVWYLNPRSSQSPTEIRLHLRRCEMVHWSLGWNRHRSLCIDQSIRWQRWALAPMTRESLSISETEMERDINRCGEFEILFLLAKLIDIDRKMFGKRYRNKSITSDPPRLWIVESSTDNVSTRNCFISWLCAFIGTV